MKKILSFIILQLFLLYSNNYAQVNTEVYRIATDSLGLSVKSDLDFALMVGNSDFQHMGTNTRFNYNWGKHYTFLVINGGFGRNDGKNFFSQALAHLRNVNSLSKFVQLEEFFQYDNNKKRLLKHRMLMGGGFRFKVINQKKLKTRIGTSMFYEYENYDLEADAEHVINDESFRLSTYCTVIMRFRKDITFLNTIYIQPDIKDFDDSRILSDSALNIKLGKIVDFSTKLNIRYDNQPADGIKKFDLITKLGIVLNFE